VHGTHHPEIEARIARRDLGGLSKEDLPTPCLILDHATFERNLHAMAAHSRATGVDIRPHVKIHKCVEIARRQLELGANGVTTATIAEAELMSASGIDSVLWTRQPAGKNNIARAVALSGRHPGFMFVVDDPLIADQVEAAAAASRVRCRLVVDVHAGATRHGIQAGAPALDLARRIHASPHLTFGGLMGYCAYASHVKGWQERRAKSRHDLAGLIETVNLARGSGLPVAIVTGGSTGTYDIDAELGLTELQCGSYVFMDTTYRKIGGRGDDAQFTAFELALTVLTTVVSKRHAHQCTIDAGNKAMLRPTDEVKGLPSVTIENQGAEYGILKWPAGERDLELGERVETYPTNLDMTTSVYDRIFVTEGEAIVDVWSVMGRGGAPQR
jgi:D-serine deaminase-like pyridoxal phosphate-dependent protein